MTAAILRFPGTNCERDTAWAFEEAGAKTAIVWHTDTQLPSKTDLVVIPGGFSYGDYLRCGAIARLSAIMSAVKAFAENGGKVLGICNGFQILLEAGLLPGAMRRNENLHFISRLQRLLVVSANNRFTSKLKETALLTMPIAHAEGNYYIDADGLKSLRDNDQIVLTYCDEEGRGVNVNGAEAGIAGICNKKKNVFALMPHPERAASGRLGSTDGLLLIKSVLES
ncbi:MAG: phosphoribosylformylglycinamidine synthase subunit PurQ [Helicobacteraceae bacterium]|jgi:phosphoribosylformylglycinamidine synthase|nr:phosphoribosylformylglycinamidine synthase subunit PurQ [Helicobacteraceae bacterium]